MSKFVEWAQSLFGEGTPQHRMKAKIEGQTVKVEISLEQPSGPMIVRYAPGTEIHIGDEGYRPFGENEVIHAKEIYFFGAGMSNGITLEDVYFKAMGDPLEVLPLKMIPPEEHQEEE
ncbi:MAG: hypothetical protein A2785_04160 [Candidatus Chisholmbacteria bacterium RIFCSPHIGHO2_01_FULL_49_18]|uniref:Uncharacterized protein n=2 Tax=Candidatus Chisholmiibacteriota TaxID=1817900 RepID=A0A1G1VP55_9BACT|nr:MAG: hypothetical protein A2785_04160 [Candidatus Chisholmbacteria bacterium RIFCSPHIGHO2_01_FULL_49_18]OGY22518.1 MAG: hypothetical protein A3A65_00825 [Candidatus Chisholmbacteria bacterium RIFCSPLOWO2_01_FULL_49_14]